MSFEDILKRGEADINRLLGRDHTSAATATAAVTIRTSTPGGPVSLSADLHNLATRIEHIGEEGFARAEAIAANPEADSIASDLAHLAGLNLPPNTLASFGAGLKALLGLFTPQQAPAGSEPSFTPAGPTVAGQA